MRQNLAAECFQPLQNNYLFKTRDPFPKKSLSKVIHSVNVSEDFLVQWGHNKSLIQISGVIFLEDPAFPKGLQDIAKLHVSLIDSCLTGHLHKAFEGAKNKLPLDWAVSTVLDIQIMPWTSSGLSSLALGRMELLPSYSI